MPEKTLIFKSLKYNDILEPEFNSFEVNGRNTLDFKMLQSGGMVVVYAPNGTGKTTLANLLGSLIVEYCLFVTSFALFRQHE